MKQILYVFTLMILIGSLSFSVLNSFDQIVDIMMETTESASDQGSSDYTDDIEDEPGISLSEQMIVTGETQFKRRGSNLDTNYFKVPIFLIWRPPIA